MHYLPEWVFSEANMTSAGFELLPDKVLMQFLLLCTIKAYGNAESVLKCLTGESKQ